MSTTVTVLVCGGRDFGLSKDEYLFITTKLDELFHQRGWEYEPDEYGNTMPNVKIISGEARGVDTVAADYAVTRWTQYRGFPANWDLHGKAAGVIRNQQMLDEGKPDVVVAFKGGRGTEHMKKIAREAGVEVIEIVQDKQ